MTVHADGSITERRYWRPEYHFDENRNREDTARAIDEVMRDSVRYHNVADVEVGSFLSSGIDSSYMAACLAKEKPDIKTFTVGFECYKQAAANNAEGAGGKTMRDEISWARELADDLHIANTDKYIGEEEYWASLPRVQWHMDEPSADPSAVALYFVDQIAATQVKAVLSGEGADEFFGGYRIYQTPFSNAKVSWAPKGLLKGASHAMRALHLRGANYLERASETPEDWYYTNANGVAFTPEERASLLKGGCSAPTPQSLTAPVYAEVADLDETTRMQYVDLYFWLVGDILLKTDKMSMAHSLESRVPFLDRRVFDLSATIPTSLKANEQQTKLTLRDAAEFAIPKDWAQKEKLGFPVPVVNWLREERYYTMVKKWFTGDIAREHGAQVRVERRQGKGNVVRQMMRDIDADYYIMVDGDDTYPAEAAPELLAPLMNDEADMVVGDRLSNGTYGEENDRAFHGFGNNLVRFLIKAIYGFEFSDVMTGYRAYNEVFAKSMPVLSPGFEIETELSIHAVDKRWRIAEVPIDYRDRPEGSESKLNTFSDGMKVLMMILSLFKDYRPLALFSLLGLLLCVVGLLFGVPVIWEFAHTGLVPKLPTALLAVAFIFLGMLSFSCGLILDTVVKGARKQYELEVTRIYEECGKTTHA